MSKNGNNIIDTVKNYKSSYFQKDIFAGLSIAALSIPQNMAYALVVGINPVYGLYTSIISKIISTFTGRSNYIIVGPTNLMALAIASNLSYVQDDKYLSTVILLTFLVGIFQVIAGIFKLGKLVRYVSHPVIIGLTTGAAIIIGVGQLKNLIGINIDRTYNIFIELYILAVNFPSIDTFSLLLGIVTILTILIIEKSKYRMPSYLLGILVVTFIVMLLGFNDTIATVGSLDLSGFSFNIPDLQPRRIINISSKALAVAIVGLIQALAVVKSMSIRADEDIDIDNEFISQGIMNFGLSFFSGFASSASFTNTFANYQEGAKTRISELVSAFSILVFILFFNFFIKFIPIASLAGLVLIVAYKMVNIGEIKEILKARRTDIVIFSLTFLATISFPRIEYAVYFGVILSLISLIKDSSNAKVDHFKYDVESHSKFVETIPDQVKDDEYIILDLVGQFTFSATDDLKSELQSVSDVGRGYILRFRSIEKIDITTVYELKKFIKNVQDKEKEVLISGLDERKYQILKKQNIVDLVGEENIFFEKDFVFSSTEEAVEKGEDKNQ